MGWKDLLQKADETIVLPWLGDSTLRSTTRMWNIEGRRPTEFGWHRWTLIGRKARWKEVADALPENLVNTTRGYLVGDRIVPFDARVDPNPARIVEQAEAVYLIEEGLSRFVPVTVGRPYEDGPYIYQGQAMPLGPEDDVLQAFLDHAATINNIPGVVPALDAAFRMETWQRSEAERRLAEIEKKRREEEERLAREERRKLLVQQIGDGASRRELALVDFGAAAKAALLLGGAVYLDHTKSPRRGVMNVRFRLRERRFACTCDEKTLAIIDAGICLTAHYDDEDGFEQGTRGDQFFTLESLPLVIEDAIRQNRLVVHPTG